MTLSVESKYKITVMFYFCVLIQKIIIIRQKIYRNVFSYTTALQMHETNNSSLNN